MSLDFTDKNSIKAHAKSFDRMAAQGDVLFVRVGTLPEGLKKKAPVNGEYVVAHSETGHHHVIEAEENVEVYETDDALVDYVVVDAKSAYVVHMRSHRTHGPIEFTPDVYEIRRQREHVSEGFRRVMD